MDIMDSRWMQWIIGDFHHLGEFSEFDMWSANQRKPTGSFVKKWRMTWIESKLKLKKEKNNSPVIRSRLVKSVASLNGGFWDLSAPPMNPTDNGTHWSRCKELIADLCDFHSFPTKSMWQVFLGESCKSIFGNSWNFDLLHVHKQGIHISNFYLRIQGKDFKSQQLKPLPSPKNSAQAAL